MPLYDSIGKSYNRTRSADNRILNKIISQLNCPAGSIIADIGAGTGNYSYELSKLGYFVHALEPSETMIEQGKKHDNLKWFKGFAEDIPFEDNYFDGVICTLSTHHFKSLNKSFTEIHRILKPNGNLVIFTFDARKTQNNDWLKEYFNPFYKIAVKTAQKREFVVRMLEKIFKTKVNITNFQLPSDLADHFFYAGWKHPEKYLDEDFRKGISVFSMLSQKKTAKIINRLEIDLQTGVWNSNYNYVKKLDKYEGGYYFMAIKKAE